MTYESPMPLQPGMEGRRERPMMSVINKQVRTRADLRDWIYRSLGFGMQSVELTTEQLDDAIDNATMLWTKYADLDKKYGIFNLAQYPVKENGHLEGFDVSAFRATAVAQANKGDIFSTFAGDGIWALSNCMLATGSYPFFGTTGQSTGFGGMTTYQAAFEFCRTAQRLFDAPFDADLDVDRQLLRLVPNPVQCHKNKGYICVEFDCVPIDEIVYGQEYVKRMALAYAKITLGYVRKKFSGLTLIAGGNVDSSIGDEGKNELDKLITELSSRESIHCGVFFA